MIAFGSRLSLLATATLFVVSAAHAQPVTDPVLRGAIDIHSHVDPDGYGPGHNGRAFDSLELARLAKDAGMRGFVIKMHYDQSADDAYLVRKLFPDLEIFGGIGTNFATGVGSWAPTGTASETRVFQFTYTVSPTAPSTVMGGTAQLGLTWEAQNS